MKAKKEEPVTVASARVRRERAGVDLLEQWIEKFRKTHVQAKAMQIARWGGAAYHQQGRE